MPCSKNTRILSVANEEDLLHARMQKKLNRFRNFTQSSCNDRIKKSHVMETFQSSALWNLTNKKFIIKSR